tara:strand:+ start:82 stop:468 length:387 start_codon:yes stop_codon:yes gene_type:complete
MLEKLKNWWKWNPEFEKNSADNPVTALSEQQRRNAGPLLALAFGWGFLVTGLFTGGLLGNGLPFWPDIVLASFWAILSILLSVHLWAILATKQHATAVSFTVMYMAMQGHTYLLCSSQFCSLAGKESW